ncbi:MAG: hypothetical protein JRF33_04330 [Deltaproteobacteria bacterium]|nr:hypothetical protein [Deltaproteobacteria bacterium]
MKRGLTLSLSLGLLVMILGGCGGGGSNCKEGQGAALFLTVQPTTTFADGSSSVTISITGQDLECKPLPIGTLVDFSLSGANPADVGQFSNSETTISKTMNAFGAQVDLTSSTVGTVEVNATVAGLSLVAEPVTVTFEEPLPTGNCRMTVQANPPSVIANGATQTTITATLVGDDGQAMPDGVDVEFSTTLGLFSNSETTITMQTSGGQTPAVLTSEIVDSDTEVTVTVSAICNDDLGTLLIVDSLINFISARPTVTITPSAADVLGNGTDTVELSAQVRLNDGSAAGADVPLNFTTNLGEFDGRDTYDTVTDADGVAVATLTGGIVGGTATVQATATIGSEDATGRQDITVRGLQTVTLTSTETALYGDGVATSTMTAVVSLSDGAPAWAGMQVDFSTDLGTFAESSNTSHTATTDASGRATATFIGGLDGGTALITATASVGATTAESLPTPVLVMGLDAVALATSASEILADGVSTVDLRATVTLSNGDRAWQGMTVVFTTATLGTFTESGLTSFTTTTDANGEAVATFLAGTDGGDTVITALAQVGTSEVTDTTTITLRALGNMNLICAKAAVLADGVSSVLCTASAYLDNGDPVGEGTQVDFTMDPERGIFAESGNTSHQTTTSASGLATASFVPGITQGLVTITATATVEAQTAEATFQINVQELSSIEVDDIQNMKLGVSGSGRNETSRVTFLVNDANGDSLPEGCPVEFSLSTAPGFPSIEPLESNTNEFGKVWTTVRSGIAATSITVTARAYVPDPADPVNNPPVKEATATTTSLAIVGAKPNARYLTFSCELGNLNRAGFGCDFLNTKCTIGLADRYSNKIGLETNVNFSIEAGAITPNAVTSEGASDMGQATAFATTGEPFPQDVTPFDPPNVPVAEPRQYLVADARTANPRDGLVTILATTTGEEEFTDLNADGDYNAGEPFIDLGEPFRDRNDNGDHDTGEFYVDVNGNEVYDGPNGVWDTDTVIWTVTWMMWSKGVMGHQVDGFYVNLGENVDVYYRFWDENLNPITAESASLDATLDSDVGNLNKTFSVPSLSRTIQDSIGLDIHLKKVKPNLRTACCVGLSAECPALDEICEITTIVQNFSSGIDGTVRIEGEEADTQNPPDDAASVVFDLDFRLCPGGVEYSYPFSTSGGIDGCHPQCGECGPDGCGGSCGDCVSPATCQDGACVDP